MPIERSGPPNDELAPILAAACDGDEDAWKTLVERFWRRVYALVRSRCGKSDLAEEITQSVFVTVATTLRDGGYQERGRFESWLFLVAMNRLRDELRRQRRQAAPTDPATMVGISGDDRHEHRDDQSEELEALRAAVARLAEPDREIIELRHHAGLSFKQIAQTLDEPIGTLLARHHRALKKLRSMMEETGERAALNSPGMASPGTEKDE